MCYLGGYTELLMITSMPSQYIFEAWNILTDAGYHLQRGERDEVIITAPGGYVSRVRAKRLPSLARYVG